MKAFLNYPGSECNLMLLDYSSKSSSVHGCLVSHTQVMHKGTCYKDLGFLVPLNSLILGELSKNHMVPTARPKQPVKMVLWEAYGLSKWYGCKNISKSPWVYRVYLFYARNSGLVIHSYTILMTFNNLFPDDLNRDCYLLHYIYIYNRE